MIEVRSIYQGNLRTQATHGPSGNAIGTDAPKDNEGLGETFSPTDLVASAMGSCMLTIMGIVARRRDWPLEGAHVRVEKHMAAEPLRRIGKLVVEFHLPSALPEVARPAMERAALTCPVHQSLHPDIEIPITFHYDVS